MHILPSMDVYFFIPQQTIDSFNRKYVIKQSDN